VAGQWFSPGTPVSFTNKTDCHNITEILLKVALNTIHELTLDLTELCKHDQMCFSKYTIGATIGAETAYPTGAHEFTHSFSGVPNAQLFCRSLFVPVGHCIFCPSSIYGL
jgi:hypothetical protein